MSNSAFQQRQTGNASETAAGSVEQATAAEVAAKTDIGASGAPLFVVPSLIPQGSTVELTAYEAIAAGDAVGLSWATPVQTETYNNITNRNAGQSITATQWVAQRFTLPTTFSGKQVIALMSNGLYASTTGIGGLTISVRATLTGPDLYSFTHTFNSGGTYIQFTASTPSGVIPGGTYYLVARGGTSANIGYSSTNTNPPPGSEAHISTDSGANWTAQSGRNYIMFESCGVNPFEHFKVFKSSAASLTTLRLNVLGFAQNTVSAGGIVTVNISNIITGLTGLTAGKLYFLSDTNGAISQSAGTNRLYIGRAISTTSILRGFDGKTSSPIALSSGDFYVPAPGIITRARDIVGSVIHYDRINYDAGEVAYTRSASYSTTYSATIDVRTGDMVSLSAGALYYQPHIMSF